LETELPHSIYRACMQWVARQKCCTLWSLIQKRRCLGWCRKRRCHYNRHERRQRLIL